MDWLTKKLEVIYHLPGVRGLVLGLVYASLLSGSLWLSYQLRFDFFRSGLYEENRIQILQVILWVVPIKLAILYFTGQFSGLLSYFSTPDLFRLGVAVVLCSSVMILARLMDLSLPIAPRGVVLLDFILSFVAIAGFRTAFRVGRERLGGPSIHDRRRRSRRIGILGAGDVGASLAKELLNKRGLGRVPVAFFDDEVVKQGARIYNIPVFGVPERLLDSQLNLQLDEAVIAMPSAPAKRIGEIVSLLQELHLEFTTVPSIEQMTTGQVRVSQLRPVDIQDLLGRPPVNLQRENIRQLLKGKVVMVTGAGGSIGSELCRQIVAFNPERLLMVDQSEFSLFEIEQELGGKGFFGIITPLVADVLDQPRMEMVFSRYRPAIVFHAAAHKHVPMMEGQPSEAIKNNSFGTARTAELSMKSEVECFVMISTDKAINPTNVMGASKRLAEIYIQALHHRNQSPTKLMAVRFGNVLGSSGSVIPTFKRQIAEGGPVKVTHPDMTRYFMTIPEAVGLVLQSGAQGNGGEIFVLDMGEPIKIVDLARQLIELSGLKPEEDIEIEFIGLRPGEKLFEELQYVGEDVVETEHPKIRRLVCAAVSLNEIQVAFESLGQCVHTLKPEELKLKIQELVPEYRPYFR